MKSLINEMESFQLFLKKENVIKNLISYFRNQFYVYVFLKQNEKLLTNIKSINALLLIGNVEDAYTIFRKYIETYSIIMSIYENKELVNKYMIHDLYIGYKACGEKKEELQAFISNKPDGYLEYGYLESVVDSSKYNFRYTIKTVCMASKLNEYYGWYRICNNFVHNNLSSVVINPSEGKIKLIEKCKKSFYHLKKKLDLIT